MSDLGANNTCSFEVPDFSVIEGLDSKTLELETEKLYQQRQECREYLDKNHFIDKLLFIINTLKGTEKELTLRDVVSYDYRINDPFKNLDIVISFSAEWSDEPIPVTAEIDSGIEVEIHANKIIWILVGEHRSRQTIYKDTLYLGSSSSWGRVDILHIGSMTEYLLDLYDQLSVYASLPMLKEVRHKRANLLPEEFCFFDDEDGGGVLDNPEWTEPND